MRASQREELAYKVAGFKPQNVEDASSNPGDRVFRLCPKVQMEGFEDGALLLRLEDHYVFELNPTAYRVLVMTDGQRSAAQTATALAGMCEVSEAEALQDISSLYTQLSVQGIVEPVELDEGLKENHTVEERAAVPRYIRNPDVVLREEDPEAGGLLFNPDTNQVKIVNATSLFIWRQCDGTRSVAEIATAMLEAFEDAPAERVAEDVREFIEEMTASAFIGIVETLGGGG